MDRHETSLQDIDSKIIGGRETEIQNHPYIFSLRNPVEHRCGGSVITSTRGLTAIHCMIPHSSPVKFRIMAGSTTREGDGNQQLRTLYRFLMHPKYSKPRKLQNDNALLYWEEPLTFGKFVRPIALPPQGAVLEHNKPCNVSGWGTQESGEPTEILRTVTMPIVNNEICNQSVNYNGFITADMLCAGLLEGGIDACHQDR